MNHPLLRAHLLADLKSLTFNNYGIPFHRTYVLAIRKDWLFLLSFDLGPVNNSS